MPFSIVEEPLPDLLVIQPDVFGDARGFFMETWNEKHFEAIDLKLNFVQDNLSHSRRGILRGLHFQKDPWAQGKLVSVLQGKVQDVAVDLRKDSPTYGQHHSIELSGENHTIFYVPPGFAHGFLVLSETCLFHYKCTNSYNREAEGGLMWNDPALGIEWQLEGMEPLLSEKDQHFVSFGEFETPF